MAMVIAKAAAKRALKTFAKKKAKKKVVKNATEKMKGTPGGSASAPQRIKASKARTRTAQKGRKAAQARGLGKTGVHKATTSSTGKTTLSKHNQGSMGRARTSTDALKGRRPIDKHGREIAVKNPKAKSRIKKRK